ncbi:MAG: hypothetical protein ACXVXM_01670 [Nocardioidaceae bacterium]
MARRPAAAAAPGPARVPLQHWRQYDAVRWPGRDDARIDEVVVGHSGVFVVQNRAAPATSPGLAEDVGSAASAAAAVAVLLPARYRATVRPAVCLLGGDEVADDVDGVLVASPSALRHSLRYGPRRLSTSEVAEICTRLDARLQLVPAPARPPRRSLWRRFRWASARRARRAPA